MRYGRELPGYPFNAKALLTRCLIVAQRKVYGGGCFPWSDFTRARVTWPKEIVQEKVAELLKAGKPTMIARYGSFELEATLRGLAIAERRMKRTGMPSLLLGRCSPYWWDNSIRGGLCWNAGFFPPTDEALEAFARRFAEDSVLLDVLTSTWPGEEYMRRRYCPNAEVCGLSPLSSPFFFVSPWTRALAGKTVLIVNPFASTIASQYAKREKLFSNPLVLPEFRLLTYRPCVSQCGNADSCGVSSWFDALDKMSRDIRSMKFDVALIGAGAYGFCLAADVKRSGRIGIQLGGSTQLLFGIKGGRWDETDIGKRFYNEHWVRPAASEVPTNARTVEGGCYW